MQAVLVHRDGALRHEDKKRIARAHDEECLEENGCRLLPAKQPLRANRPTAFRLVGVPVLCTIWSNPWSEALSHACSRVLRSNQIGAVIYDEEVFATETVPTVGQVRGVGVRVPTSGRRCLCKWRERECVCERVRHRRQGVNWADGRGSDNHLRPKLLLALASRPTGSCSLVGPLAKPGQGVLARSAVGASHPSRR